MSVSEPIPLQFSPQVVKDTTRRSADRNFFDCDMVRFVSGYPQSIGGWEKISSTAVRGTPRALFAWSSLDGYNLMAVGTHLKYYVEQGGTFEDVTPIRASITINNNPFATTNGSSIITVTDTGHGAEINDFVTFSGATGPIGGLADSVFNAEHQIVSIIDSNSYTIDVTTPAGSTASGGGASVTAAYQIHSGLDTTAIGGGWGAGAWGRGTWGSSVSSGVEGAQLRLWSQDNFGEDLIFNPRGGAIYFRDTSAGASRGTNIVDLGGSNEAPVVADQVLVATDERTIFAFGCNPIGTSVADPLMVRWADRESVIEWEPTTATTAGGRRLSIGSRHMIAVKARQGIGTFTDKALYLLQPLGTGDWGVRLIADKVHILGPKAATSFDGIIYWMATRGIFSYAGGVAELPSSLTQFIYRRMNRSQAWKAHVGVNPEFGEILFSYCSTNSSEIDSLVRYNVKDQTWAPGTLARTAWCEAAGSQRKPRGADVNGYVYEHEQGLNDGSTNPPGALNSYIETGLFPVNATGKYQYRLRGFWPDVSFEGSTAAIPEVTMSIRLQDKIGSADSLEEMGDVVRTVTIPVQEFTDKIDIKKRARFMALRVDCTAKDTAWQLGVPQIEAIQDGKR